jgi:RHS repeat-associated protein
MMVHYTPDEAALYWYHTDHLGTPQALTDRHGQIAWQAQYDPFGEVVLLVNNVTQPLRFPGQYFDEETGLHYNYFRDYDPGTGRYVQSDPIGVIKDYGDPEMQVSNLIGVRLDPKILEMTPNQLYVYVMNNPFSFHDFYGLISCDARRKVCRVDCRRKPHLSGPCLEACEGKYGALSDCKDELESDSGHGETPSDCPSNDPAPDPLIPDCTFERWRAGQC